MAELVQRHLESMTEEIEEMRRTKLYSVEETRAILKKRKEFEYKINGISKHVQDYKDYIEYEKSLLKKINSRREKSNMYERKSSIEYKIRRRMKTLYEIALQRFSDDFALWLSYFKFCKELDHIGAASQAVQSMIKHFSYKPEVWQIAAEYYANDREETNTALEILYKGLTMHKDSQLLYKEAIKLELIKVGSQISNNDEFSEEESRTHTVCNAKIKTYLKSIFESIKDINFFIEILYLLEPYSFTTDVQSLVIEFLMKRHSDEPIVWHVLAQRELRDLHHSSKGETINYSTMSSFIFCVEKYKEGFHKVALSKKSELWSYYLDFLIDSQKDTSKASSKKTLTLLKNALQDASSQKCLAEKYYILWLEFLNDDEVLPILEKATLALPKSVELWKLRLKFATFGDDKDQIKKIFKLGVITLKEKALPLWLHMLRYASLAMDTDIVESIYRDGIKQPEEISQVLKPKYVEWLALARNEQAARAVYYELAQQKPYCKELHAAMSKVEATGAKYNIPAWERVHQLACRQFGKDDVDVWLNYVQFHLDFNKDDDLNEKVQRVYREATNSLSMSSLSQLLLADFNERYQNLLSQQ